MLIHCLRSDAMNAREGNTSHTTRIVTKHTLPKIDSMRLLLQARRDTYLRPPSVEEFKSPNPGSVAIYAKYLEFSLPIATWAQES